MKANKTKYKVVGAGPFAVVDSKGVIEYDLLDNKVEAKAICHLLNRGIGPEWDKIEPHLSKEAAVDKLRCKHCLFPRRSSAQREGGFPK